MLASVVTIQAFDKIAFPEITQAILIITNGLAKNINDLSEIEKIMKIAGTKIETYQNPSFKSILVFYCARFIMVAIFHFSWSFLTILLLLFYVFSSKMNINLFKSMIEIAS